MAAGQRFLLLFHLGTERDQAIMQSGTAIRSSTFSGGILLYAAQEPWIRLAMVLLLAATCRTSQAQAQTNSASAPAVRVQVGDGDGSTASGSTSDSDLAKKLQGGRLVKLGGKLPVNVLLGAYYNPIRPKYGATWQIRAQVALIF